jgi:hypothetical protein
VKTKRPADNPFRHIASTSILRDTLKKLTSTFWPILK